MPARSAARRRRDGRYQARTNLGETDSARLWSDHPQLVQVEKAFRTLKSDPAICRIFHQVKPRIEVHVFLANGLHVTLARQLRPFAPGQTARSALAKFGATQRDDVRLPTTDARERILTRHTESEPGLGLLLEQLKLTLPPGPKPRITTADARCSADL